MTAELAKALATIAKRVPSDLEWTADSGGHPRIKLGKLVAEQAAEIERLRKVESAALRFVKEVDERPRYLSVRTWATPDADPYFQLRAAFGLR